ncbi:MAG: LysR family transcriptional regulator [Polyangiales bacterium]
MSRINYNQLFTFFVTAMAGSVRNAATVLGVTAPTVSEQLRALEETFGAALVERRERRQQLTPQGERVFAIARNMFAHAEALNKLSEGQGVQVKALVRIGVTPSLGRSLTSSYFDPLFRSDSLQPELCYRSATELFARMMRQQLDLALTDMAPPEVLSTHIEAERIAALPTVVVAPRPLRGEGWSGQHSLHTIPFLRTRPDSDLSWAATAFFERRAMEPETAAEVDDVPMILHLVAQGKGFAVVPEVALQDSPHRDAIDIVERLHDNAIACYLLRTRQASSTREYLNEISGELRSLWGALQQVTAKVDSV